MRRVIITDKDGTPFRELSDANVFRLVRKEEVNGEHSLAIDTDMVMQKGWRILTQDARGKWREYVVYSIDDVHDRPGPVASSCWCVWSLMYDLAGTRVSKMPGTESPVNAQKALEDALSGTSRWAVGTVENLATGGASMYDMSGWEAVKVMLDNWGGEIDVTIEVTRMAVSARKVDYAVQLGDPTPSRRFDFGADLKSVRRKLGEGPLYCRITPRGKGEPTEGGGYGRKITIESVNGGKDYLQDAQMATIARVPDGNGGWEYPTVEIENSDMETPADLKAWAESVMEQYTRPSFTYEVDAVQASAEGVDVMGVSLGDAVHIVDRGFGDGLRLSGRVSSMTVDMLDEHSVSIVIGNVAQGMAGALGGIMSQFDSVRNGIQAVMEQQAAMATATYIKSLLGRINAEINATGGYTYITEGQGLRTYDVAVSDPLVGAEATKVVELKGGNIRIADSKDSQGNWEWKTVLQSGHILAELVTAAQLVSGYIGSSTGSNYWNLDTGEMRISADITVGGRDNSNGVIQVLDASGNVISTLDKDGVSATGAITLAMDGFSSGEKIYAAMGSTTYNTQYSSVRQLRGLRVYNDNGSYSREIALGINNNGEQLALATNAQTYMVSADSSEYGQLYLSPGDASLEAGVVGYDRDKYYLRVQKNKVSVNRWSQQYAGAAAVEITPISGGQWSKTEVTGDFSVSSGTKSKLVGTDDYGKRLLYCYETPAPMFGDVCSGVVDDDGFCYVSIDDIFAETANSGMDYQVFLQKCGSGDCWVAEKAPSYFAVQGTPGLAFDWELKAHQTGYEDIRIEEDGVSERLDDAALDGIEFPDYPDYVTEMQKLYEQEMAS